jgi:hypothetical protein
VTLVSLALMHSIVPADSMTVTVLILLGAVAEGMRRLSKRLSRSQLTLSTESFDLTLQTKQHLSQQELLQQELGGNDNGRSNDDDGRISDTNQRIKW